MRNEEWDTRIKGIIIKEIELKHGATGDYCHFCIVKFCFATKKKIGPSRGIKSWNVRARSIVKEFKNGDRIEVFGVQKYGNGKFSDYIDLIGYNHLDADGNIIEWTPPASDNQK